MAEPIKLVGWGAVRSNSALVNDSTRENLWSRLSYSDASHQVFRQLGKEIKRIDKLQQKHHVEVPIILNPVASGLVEAWAQGTPWEQVMRATNVGEGDLVRMIRRTADLLRQLSRIDRVPPGLSALARKALDGINREPVREVEVLVAAEETETPGPLDETPLVPDVIPVDFGKTP